MAWPAASRFGLACIASSVVACGGTKHSGEGSIGNNAPAKQRDLTAAYYCSIEDSGYRYPNFPCAIHNVSGRWVLAKLAGSQRFRGEVRPLGEGFTFDGEYFCPFGDCSAPMHGEFQRRPNGTLVGRFTDTQVVVTLTPAPANAVWGGTGYGGDAYGGFGYGGWGYGGASYGLQQPTPPRSNRRP